MPTITTPVREFSDLDFGFSKHPVSRSVMKKRNIEAIKASIKNLVLTSHFERPFHPEIGSNIYYMLFENYSPLVDRIIERNIKDTVDNFEPRAIINTVSVNVDGDNAVRVTIDVTPVNINTQVSFNILLERVR